jgi:hypothetical protein
MKRTVPLALACSGALLAASLVAVPVRAADTVPTSTLRFPTATLVRGQNARLNFVNLADPLDVEHPPDPCHVVAFFLDAGGKVVSRHSFALAAGQSTAGRAFPPGPTRPGLTHVRAVVSLQPPPIGDRSNCALAVTFEVYDRGTGATQVVLPAVQNVLVAPPEPD